MHQHRGVTLVELVIAIVVIAIGVTGVLAVLNLSTGHSADPVVREQAVAVAEGYLEEALLKDFVDPPATTSNCPGGTLGPEGGETRDTYDDVDDYDGLADSGARDQRGQPLGGLSQYDVAMTVRCEALSDVGQEAAKRVEVTVTPPGNQPDVVISGYRTFFETAGGGP